MNVAKKTRGIISVELLILFMVLMFLVFASVDYFNTLIQYQLAQHLCNYYLERVRVCGRLTTADETEMITKFSGIGLTVESIASVPRESLGQPAVTKNLDNPDGCKITMTLTLKPAKRPFLIGYLVGGDMAADSFRIKVGGTVLSEKI